MPAIHQLLPVLSPGDAIGQAVRRLRAAFRAAGFASETFVEQVHPSLRSEARPVEELEASVTASDVVLYHLSIGAPCARLFSGLACRRVIVYHNITPARFYATTSPRVAYWLEQGRRDLDQLAPTVELGIGDSEYNAAELRAADCPVTMVIPPSVDLDRLHPRTAKAAGPPLLIFVSRLAPNKRQEQLIRALAALRECSQPEATLVLPGGWGDTETYVAGLRRFAADLGVTGAVEIPGRLSDRQLGDLYARASVAVCTSEHEGFGMHLLEAMAFDLPLVARAAAAVPETLGEAGILLTTTDPLVWAAVIDRVLRDQPLRRQLIAQGRSRLRDFSDAALQAHVSEMIERLGLAEASCGGKTSSPPRRGAA
jgi:glycosyltransferase involved in cell wall biosynthesis